MCRFSEELEFVQALCNPHYLHYLYANGHFENPRFLDFLGYLEYWRSPEYSRFLLYPHSLNILSLLKSSKFLGSLGSVQEIENLMEQSYLRWKRTSLL
jgi:mediator of RNA polymerase II transcription subunit 31